MPPPLSTTHARTCWFTQQSKRNICDDESSGMPHAVSKSRPFCAAAPPFSSTAAAAVSWPSPAAEDPCSGMISAAVDASRSIAAATSADSRVGLCGAEARLPAAALSSDATASFTAVSATTARSCFAVSEDAASSASSRSASVSFEAFAHSNSLCAACTCVRARRLQAYCHTESTRASRW